VNLGTLKNIKILNLIDTQTYYYNIILHYSKIKKKFVILKQLWKSVFNKELQYVMICKTIYVYKYFTFRLIS